MPRLKDISLEAFLALSDYFGSEPLRPLDEFERDEVAVARRRFRLGIAQRCAEILQSHGLANSAEDGGVTF